MSDQTYPGVGTKAYVAYRLLLAIAEAEQKADTSASTAGVSSFNQSADKKWILDTYGECLQAVAGGQPRVSRP